MGPDIEIHRDSGLWGLRVYPQFTRPGCPLTVISTRAQWTIIEEHTGLLKGIFGASGNAAI